MAPTKKDEKEAKLTPEQSATLVLDYLRKQNRPYSATDISTNLKNRVTKAAAAKLLKDMHERNEIEGRAAGKQLVYHAIQVRTPNEMRCRSRKSARADLSPAQEEADGTSLSALRELHAETERLKDATAALKSDEKPLRASLRDAVALPPLPELKAAVASLRGEKEALAARLAMLREGGVKPISAEERARVDAEHEKWRRAVVVRRRIRAEMWKTVEDVVGDGERAKEVKERLGLEGL